jgi:purine-nucleoside phosphorylase
LIASIKPLDGVGLNYFYEGYNYQQIVFPIRVMKLLGIKTLLLSNASGCINLNWKKGELMLLDDHINLHIDNPLIGKNIDEFGTRFPDLSAPYDLLLNQKLIAIAKKQNTTLHQGVYASIPGPNLETKAEYRLLRNLGADAVGMSTVPEVIVARQMGIPVFGISVITDMCIPETLKKAEIENILAAAYKAEPNMTLIIKQLIGSL